jgi:leucyl aminopeptidase (aminopeptidase T)
MEYWFGDCSDANILVITDKKQYKEINNVLSYLISKSIRYILVDDKDFLTYGYENLTSEDLLIIALSIDSFIFKGYNRYFSPFNKPENLSSKYVFIRLDITEKALMQGLNTPLEDFKEVYNQYKSIPKNSMLYVNSKSGTDLEFKINEFKTCSHRISADSDKAFLPPSELEAGIELGTANGTVVIDCTIGQINQYGKWLGMFGLIKESVILKIKDSYITDIIGNEELKKILFSLESECRILVEFGKGLSKMTPTGIIGIDESIINTCHFGIGDGVGFGINNEASIHLDVVVHQPRVEIIS